MGAAFMGIFFFNSSLPRKIYHRALNFFGPRQDVPPDGQRKAAALPVEGPGISVETALNSRCTSDYDDDPRHFHWGMFDRASQLSPEQVRQIVSMAHIPHFTNGRPMIRAEANTLTFIIDERAAGPVRDWMMVESGMQQQAIGLTCAALGVGYVFSTLGTGGTRISDGEFATVKIKLDFMKPSYDGKYWTTSLPAGSRPWKSGNLPDPVREGGKALLPVLQELNTVSEGIPADRRGLGQILWAARGRTPHYYKSDPWGLTIPTYQGIQTISELCVLSGDRLWRYVNWKGNRPTHALEDERKVGAPALKALHDRFRPQDCFIILRKNENLARALWEIGYQLLNLMVHANSLGLGYRAVLLDASAKRLFQDAGVKDPVAALLIQFKQ
jgi:hypothetical protein